MPNHDVDARERAPAAAGPPAPVAVLDMGASAVRLTIAEAAPGRSPRVVEDLSRAVLLGRDTFSSGAIRSQTVDAVIGALEGFRQSMDAWGVASVRAVATSAVREARNGDVFLDRIRRRTGLDFEIINEAEEGRLLFLSARHVLGRHPAFRVARALVAAVGGGGTSLMLLHHGEPVRSGVYALGSVRIRQQLNLQRHPHDVQAALVRRYVANIVDEIRVELPLNRVTQFVTVGAHARFAASLLAEADAEAEGAVVEVERDRFLAFCEEVARADEDELVDRFRLAPAAAETLGPALVIHRALLSETAARTLVVCEASMRAGMLLDLAAPGSRAAAEEFERQVLASAESLGTRYQVDLDHGRHVAMLAVRLFDELREEHGLGPRHRLLLQVAALLHDIGIYVSLRAHHKHSHYILSSSQIFGLSDEETAVVANIARYHRRAAPQATHLPYVALDREDRVVVDKLAAILRLANAMDAEHAQKVRAVRLARSDSAWRLELQGDGDLTMERLAAASRADLFADTFGRQLVVSVGAV